MLAPRDFVVFFQKLQEDDLDQFQSELDVAMMNAAGN
jgi:hypothetical protein